MNIFKSFLVKGSIGCIASIDHCDCIYMELTYNNNRRHKYKTILKRTSYDILH